MRTSYSNLEVYEICPKRYEFQIIDKIKTPKTKEQFFGTTIHKCLKFLFKKAPLYPTLDELLDFFSVEWKEANKLKWRNEKEKEIYFNEGKRILENFYKKNIPSFSIPLDLESHFEVEIKDEENNTIHILSGYIDRIDKINERKFEIIDYKTGSKMPGQNSLKGNLQLSIYTLGFFKKWPNIAQLNDIILTLYYLKHGEKLSDKKTEEDILLTKQRILKNIWEIEKNYFPPIPSKLCGSCSYKKICPMWSHLYQKEEQIPEEKEINNLIKEYFSLKQQTDQNKERLNLIKKQINAYAAEKGLERVFGDEGYFSYQNQTIKDYDVERLKELLIKTNLWQEVSSLDKKKLEKLLKKMPLELVKNIESLQQIKNKKIFKAVKKDLEIIKKEIPEE
ncbi:MAG TPA: PD-(D/E)XK nuclease family protein [Candidatus Paceibacterota bacterium]|nr:PD-(D/E)XK nuclease family protein [Candidatus Paceibacterota bacterium]